MQHPGLRQAGFTQQRQGVCACLAGVHDDRLAGQSGSLQMQAERLLLEFGRLGLVVVVQPRLADGNGMRMLQLTQQPVQCRLTGRLQIERVYTDGTVDIDVTLGQRFDRRRVVGADPYAQEVSDPSRSGSIERCIERPVMGGQVESVKVTVGIYQHGGRNLLSRKGDDCRANGGESEKVGGTTTPDVRHRDADLTWYG